MLIYLLLLLCTANTFASCNFMNHQFERRHQIKQFFKRYIKYLPENSVIPSVAGRHLGRGITISSQQARGQLVELQLATLISRAAGTLRWVLVREQRRTI